MTEPKLIISDNTFEDNHLDLPLAGEVKAGFPSPAEDYPQTTLDITRLLVRNPASTFYARVSGDSMSGEGIADGDLLIIDKSVEPYDGCIAVCFIDGEFTLKRLEIHPDHALLIPANPKYKPIRVSADEDFRVWGVVRHVVKSF
ncbi:MAG: translesion error-prone DNA polymerase V autoproteolytic subunit [Tidjanibacter sp.]|nr:translesion error-prone DNA polymerase V autoproteolytic subunit [Tidjanibacter sp.]